MEVIFSDKSLIYTKKNREPKMDPCGTPALTGNQFDDCPLSSTHWNLLLRKLLIRVTAGFVKQAFTNKNVLLDNKKLL